MKEGRKEGKGVVGEYGGARCLTQRTDGGVSQAPPPPDCCDDDAMARACSVMRETGERASRSVTSS